MLSIRECGKILNTKERKYSIEELKTLRTILYKLAVIDYSIFMENQKHE